MSFSIVRSHPDLLKYVESLQAANSNALGFLPRVVFEKAAEAGQVFLGLLNGEPAGYILAGSGFQGVLRRKQVAIQYDVRRRLYGAMLVAAVEEYGENLGCVRSEVRCASDLEANEFWASLGYRLIDTQAGGKARGRQINIWSKPLYPAVPAVGPWQIGRPRIYASNAERQKAYRERLALRKRPSPEDRVVLRNVAVPSRECQNHTIDAAGLFGRLMRIFLTEDYDNDNIPLKWNRPPVPPAPLGNSPKFQQEIDFLFPS